jgi:acyl phosphate:glycerol-3-phosphate acyltransferase
MDRTQLLHAAIPLIAYLLGSVPFGLIVGALFGGKDVRNVGSGNIGATNVSRAAGPFAGILTLLLDAAKGSAAVVLAARVTGDSATWMIVAGLGALVGHCYPVWLKFKGGKGVATAAGIFLVLSPWALSLALAVFILVVVFWRFVSLGSIAAAAAIPLLMYFLWAPGHAPPMTVSLGSLAISVLVLYKHDANMQRLVEGTEAKLSFSKNSANSDDKKAG